MKKTLALFISLGIHGLMAVGLVVYLECSQSSNALATLDLTSVELSFAEKVEESAAVAIVPSSSPLEPPKPKSAANPPEHKVEKIEAPDPVSLKFPEPSEESLSFAAAAAPQQAHVDAPPSPKRTIRPDYPNGSRRRGEQGDVLLEILVDAVGAVAEATVVASSGFSELDDAAVKAVKKAMFRPAKSGGRSVASTIRLKLEFKLK